MRSMSDCRPLGLAQGSEFPFEAGLRAGAGGPVLLFMLELLGKNATRAQVPQE
jgi:hypothetical protein